jgi:hypothetical protein
MQSVRGRDRGGNSGHQAGKANTDCRDGRLIVASNRQVDAGSGAPRREVDDHEACRRPHSPLGTPGHVAQFAPVASRILSATLAIPSSVSLRSRVCEA